MEHERMEAKLRMVAGIGSLAGTTAETVGRALENYFAANAKMASRGVLVAAGGRFASAAAGVVMAVLDGLKSAEELQEDNVGMFALHAASAGLGLVVTGAAYFGSIPGWGWGAAVLLILAAIAIEVFKDNKLQDWLERCHWGKLDPAKRYTHLETEMRELSIALGSGK